MVTDSHQEDDDGADGHRRGNQEETESVHRASDPTPVIFLLWREQQGYALPSFAHMAKSMWTAEQTHLSALQPSLL